jgi:predicted CoA-substrate-specific enzyme activase
MKTLGIDIGSLSIKAVVLGDENILGTSIVPPGEEIDEGVHEAIKTALGQAHLNLDSLPVMATGIGSKSVSFISQQKALTMCLARGIHYLFPSVRMVIDMGAESTTIIKVNDRGRLADWVTHDKCASGTGFFLRQMAKLMNISLAEMAQLSLQAHDRADITSTCAVFAESEVISHVHRDPPTPKEVIAAGIHFSVVSRIISLCKRIGITKEVAVTGGVALNEGIVKILEQELNFEVLRPESPQIVAALGAAILAAENANKGIKS